MSDFTELERLLHRLAQIHDELHTLPEGPSQQRFTLLTERDELRKQASIYRTSTDEGKAVEILTAELDALKKRRDQLIKERTGYAMRGDGNQGLTSAAWVKLSSQARRAAGTASISARISAVEDLLAARARTREG